MTTHPDIDQRALAVADDVVRQMMDKGAILAVRDDDDELVPMALDSQFQLKAGWQVIIAKALADIPPPVSQYPIEEEELRYWRVWWQGSGPQRGDHIMTASKYDIGYGRELAYLGDQHHEAASLLVQLHNAVVDRLRAALTPPPVHLVTDVVSVTDGGNSITVHFSEIKSAKAFRDALPVAATPAPVSHLLPPVVTGQMEIDPNVTAADLGVNAEPEERLTVEEAWTILCETPDITSPDEYPDHALITMEQLESFMARAAPVLSVEVKPLQWSHYDSGDACARSVITAYFAHTDGSWCVRNGDRIQAGATLDDAKAAAQADYAARIRAAIATGDQP